MTTPTPAIDTGDIDAKFAAIDAKLADHEARITVLEAAPPEPIPPQPPARVIDVTEPTAANTGLNGSTGGARRSQTGDLICVKDGVYQDIDVKEGHIVLAPGAQVRRCTATGRPMGGKYYSSIIWGQDCVGALVEDCVARPSATSYRVSLNGIGWGGKGFTARWNDISGVTDYFHGTGDGMVIKANYGHHYAFHHQDPDQKGGWNHPDAIQILGGAAMDASGNAFWMQYDEQLSVGLSELLANAWYKNAWGGGYGNVITLSLNNKIPNWKVRKNWLYGGEVQFQIPAKSKGHDVGNDGELSGNRVSLAHANVWHGSKNVHHFRQDSPGGTPTGRVTVNEPNVYLAAVDKPTTTVKPGPGVTLPGTVSPLSMKTTYA